VTGEGRHRVDQETGARGTALVAERAGFTLEPQTFPGSPNYSHFPTTELLPGETYRHGMVFDFSTDIDAATGG
jgi:galactose mutarotase-like enzyme